MTTSKPTESKTDTTDVAVDADLREAEALHKAGKKLTYQQASLLRLPWDEEQTEAWSREQEKKRIQNTPTSKPKRKASTHYGW